MALNALLQHFDGAADRAEENVVTVHSPSGIHVYLQSLS